MYPNSYWTYPFRNSIREVEAILRRKTLTSQLDPHLDFPVPTESWQESEQPHQVFQRSIVRIY